MSESQITRFDFAQQLGLEAAQVLSDPLFKRSPVQSRLLRYLVEASARGGPGPTQYEIAVDGLGKDEDFDLANDSYPRVQISRLRSNLDAYYARNAPLDGRRISIELGEYLLKLTEFAEIPILDEAKEQDAPAPVVVQEEIPVVEPRAEPMEILARPETKPIELVAPQVRNNRVLVLAALVLATAALVLVGVQAWQNGSPAPSVDADVPSVALSMDQAELESLAPSLAALAEQSQVDADIQLSYSMVSNRHFEDGDMPADYNLEIHFDARSGGEGVASLLLYTSVGELLFTDRILIEPDDEAAFKRDFRAALVYVTSPIGAIAQHVAEGITEEPASAYQCFIAIEARRSNSESLAGLVDQCLERFPQDRFSSFLYARRAHAHFQQRRLADEPIRRTGQGWADVSRALEIDRFNSFANFTAAKVQLANDNCPAAAGHIERAFEGAATYPAMIAALEAEANSCAITRDDDYLSSRQLRSMVLRNPAPDPLLHIYLMLAALSSGDEESARLLADRPQVSTHSGAEHEAVQLLSGAVKDADFAQANEEELRDAIGLFLWSDSGVDRIMAALVDGPTTI